MRQVKIRVRRQGKIKVRLRYLGRAKPPDDPFPDGACEDCPTKDARISALEAVVLHMASCHQPPSHCRTCNDLLEKAGMLTDELRYREYLGDGDDCFGS